MGMGQIIEAMWELPWYKVMIIALVDDFMIFIKLWPWLILGVILFLYVWNIQST